MKKVGLLFPGQGAQAVGMFKEMYDHYDLVRSTFCEAEETLGRPVAQMCFEGPEDALDQTENTQICIFTCEIAAWRIASELGVKPEVIFGFSLGECAALVAAGCLSFAEGLKMTAYRAQVMQAAVPLGQGGMLAVLGKDEEQVRMLCEAAGQGIWMANHNCPGQIVCAGSVETIERAVLWAAANSYVVKRLEVSIPSHCPMMEPASVDLANYLQNVHFADAAIPILCGSTASPETDGAIIKQEIIGQLVCPVRCEESLRRMSEMGVETVIEAGPGHVLTGFMRKINRQVERFCLSTPEEVKRLAEGMKAW